jgi:hypothetical protein
MQSVNWGFFCTEIKWVFLTLLDDKTKINECNFFTQCGCLIVYTVCVKKVFNEKQTKNCSLIRAAV